MYRVVVVEFDLVLDDVCPPEVELALAYDVVGRASPGMSLPMGPALGC